MDRQIFPFTIITNSKQPHRDKLFLEECEDIFEQVYCSDKPDIEKAEPFFQKWKKYPEVWNWHYNALVKNGFHEEADKHLLHSIELFPDYLPARLMYARRLIEQDLLSQASAYLGNSPNLQRWYPKRHMYSNSEVVDYYSTFIELELAKGTYPRAEDHLKMLEVLEDTQTLVSKYKLQIASLKLETINDRIFAFPVQEPEYVAPQPPEYFELAPFFHPEIELILKETQTFTTDHIDILMAFPRETAIKDLEQALYRSLFADYDDYNDYDTDNNGTTHYSVPHIIWFLYAFEATESVHLVKYLLQMDTEFINHWFGDTFVEDTWFMFYLILKDNPQPLIDILYQPNLQSYPKTALIYAMEQLAYHNPENRNKVITWLSEILQFQSDNYKDRNIHDTSFASYLEDAALHLKAIELLPLLKKMHKQGCIDEEHQGDYHKVEEEMKRVDFKTPKVDLPELKGLIVS